MRDVTISRAWAWAWAACAGPQFMFVRGKGSVEDGRTARILLVLFSCRCPTSPCQALRLVRIHLHYI